MPGQGDLRRVDRALAHDDTEQLLHRALVGRVGSVSDNGVPYITPMNYVWDTEQRIAYVHCATATGHLITNLRERTAICFEVDEPGAVVPTGDYVCDTSQVYSSAIGFGEARFVEDPREKVRALRLFEQKYIKALMPNRNYNKAMHLLHSLVVIALHLPTMTGKRRETPAYAEENAWR